MRDHAEISNFTVPSTATTTDTADTVAAPNVDSVPACFMGLGVMGYDDPNDGPSALWDAVTLPNHLTCQIAIKQS